MELYFQNDYFSLFKENNEIFIVVSKLGFDIGRFNSEVLTSLPRLRITKFTSLNSALTSKVNTKILIGECIGVVECSVSNDALFAYAKLNLTQSEFQELNLEKIKQSISHELSCINVVYGKIPITKDNMVLNDKFIVAEGDAPIPGNDATVKMYELEEIKPSLESAGEVDHYELNVINKILETQWLGERIEPTKGIPGKSVYGILIPALDGKQIMMKYDPNTVMQELNEDKTITTLKARRNGAVVYKGETITVQNFIEVEGKVGFGTGNIDFNGFIDVLGSVEDNFTVVADENIQIKGDLGIGAVELIESRNGDIYIRGGIAGRNKAIIKAKGNVYTKFASNCTIISEGTVNIGFYAMNCKIIAKEVVFESINSRLIGGETIADIQLKVSELGSKSSTKTYVIIKGFNRENLKAEYDNLLVAIDTFKEKIEFYKNQYEILKNKESSPENIQKTELAFTKQQEYTQQLKKIYDTRQRYISYMQAKGEGEVKIGSKLFTNVFITLKDKSIAINENSSLSCSFYYENNEIIRI